MRRVIYAILFVTLVCTACATPTTPTSTSPTSQVIASTSTLAASTAPPQATAVPTREPTEQATATFTPAPLPTPTQEPAQLFQLMDGQCCVAPSWSADSQYVLFIDKPTADAPSGIYRVALQEPNKSELLTERVAFYTPQFDYAQIPEQAGTRLIRVSDGSEVRIKNGGRQVLISPDRTRIIWSATRDTFPTENRVANIMLANIDGTNPKQILQVLRGSVSAWLDNDRLLMSGRASRSTQDTTVFVYNLKDGSRTDIVSAERLRTTSPSRDGSWIAYTIVDDKDATRNGVWVVRSDGTGAKKLDVYGPLQWADGSHFIYVPFVVSQSETMSATTHSFWEYDAETGESQRLTPDDKPFKIAGGDWSVSPDGAKVVFVNAADRNLWVWEFPSEP